MSENVLNLAATALTSWSTLNGKHGLYSIGHDPGENPMKRARVDNMMVTAPASPMTKGVPSYETQARSDNVLTTEVDPTVIPGKAAVKAYPFFYYKDHATEEDPDPLTPLTFPGRVPNFPAKLHAILAQADLADIIDWLPHGRSWRILKPRDFETKIIPRFFEHSKFSSFIRQANGWGFRRITQGPDRNSYYHERFLRGLPHLCKSMKRPGVAEKRIVDPDLEPDFYKISEIHPVPKSTSEESIFLQKTLQYGPKARMPIITEHFNSLAARSVSPSSVLQASSHAQTSSEVQVPASAPTPSVTEVSCFPEPVALTHVAPCTTETVPKLAVAGPPSPPISPPATTAAYHKTKVLNPWTANQMAIHFPMPSLDPNDLAMSSFAAGFAAATSQYQQQFYSMMSNMAANKQLPEGFAPPNVAIEMA